MEIKKFENLINITISGIIVSIINENQILNISAKSRAGAEISDFLERQFVILSKQNKYLINAEQSPKGATKNPWDIKVYFKHQDHYEEIWIDFKAIKIDHLRSNPDIGTPTKIFDFVEKGGFYLLYVYVFYKETDNGLEFCRTENSFVKSYFLKDVNNSVRRNPKNQLQVSILAEPEYRTREEFIDLLFNKLEKSYYRQIKIAEEKLLTLKEKQKKIKELNKQQEASISANLKKN